MNLPSTVEEATHYTLKALAAVVCSLVLSACGKGDLSGEPNVVVIVIDTLRADHLASYGYRENTTPFLSHLAEQSVVFEKAYSASSWTAPATASIFTSLYPIQHGVVTGMVATRKLRMTDPRIKLNRIPKKIHTLPEMMKSRGYKTYAVTDNMNICEAEGFARGFDIFINHAYATAGTVNAEVQKLEKKIKGEGRYFLYIHYMDPHKPYHKRSPWFKADQDTEAEEISAYDSEIYYVDKMIQELFELFGWSNDTLLMITSDHGEEFHDHGGQGHGTTLFNEVIHVPFFLYYPQGGMQGKRIGLNVSTLDILPTLRDLVGLPSYPGDRGISLVPSIRGALSPCKERYLFGYLSRSRGDTKNDLFIRSVIHRGWKYVDPHPGTAQLFDLSNDPEELYNRIQETGSICQELKSRLVDFEKHCRKYGDETVEIRWTKEKNEQLKSLGYIQ